MHLQPLKDHQSTLRMLPSHTPSHFFPYHPSSSQHHNIKESITPRHSNHIPSPFALFYQRQLSNIDPYQPCGVKVQEPEPFQNFNTSIFDRLPIPLNMTVKEDNKLINERFDAQNEREHQKHIHQISFKAVRTSAEKEEIRKYREMRMKQYKQKKIRRSYEKKIVYDTRKKVADRRIRFKGKFINQDQARQLLGLEPGSYTFLQLKQLMVKVQKKN